MQIVQINAAKYAPHGTTIRVQSAREGDMVCLRIFDQGKGIPPADVERIFDKFYRLESGEKAPAGTGLGLAIARGFVEAVRGTITAANRLKLSGKECQLLHGLLRNAGKAHNHEFLLKEFWGEETDPQLLRVFIRSLRQKIEADPAHPKYILTVRGIGYRFRAPD